MITRSLLRAPGVGALALLIAAASGGGKVDGSKELGAMSNWEE